MKLSVIIVAAGNSRRMGFDKLMAELSGRPVLWHTIQRFISLDYVHEVILVTTEARFEQLSIRSSKLKLAVGGENRHDSVDAGLALVSDQAKLIAVHDGARPLVTEAQILKVFYAAKKHGAATSARKVTETIKRSDTSCFSAESIDREHLWLMETPQIFAATSLKQAYSHIEQQPEQKLVTDEVSALEQIGVATFFVENTCLRHNLKITYPQDLKIAHLLMQQGD